MSVHRGGGGGGCLGGGGSIMGGASAILRFAVVMSVSRLAMVFL